MTLNSLDGAPPLLFNMRGGDPFETLLALYHSKRRWCSTCHREVVEGMDYDRTVVSINPRIKKVSPSFPLAVGCIVSEKLLEMFQRENVSGFVPHPIRWEGGHDFHALPDYFHLEITGRVELETRLFEESGEECCQECNYVVGIKGRKILYGRRKTLVRQGSWDGSDICKAKNVFLGEMPIVSARIIDIIAAHKLDWLSFGEVIPGVAIRAPVAVDWKDEVTQKLYAKYEGV